MIERKKIVRGSIIWVAFGLAILLIWSLIILAIGENPFSSFRYLIEGSLGSSRSIFSTMARMVPLLLAGLAVAIPAWTGLWNIGGEGQLLLGGLATAYVGSTLTVQNPILAVTAGALAAFVLGAAWAFIPAILRVKLGVNEVVTTLLSTYIATYVMSYFVNHPLRQPGSSWAQTQRIAESFRLPFLVRGTQFTAGFFIAAAVLVFFALIKYRTRFGYEMTITGSNELFALAGGIKVAKTRLLAMAMGGGVAGLAGGLLVMGLTHNMREGFSPGYGFTGLLICLLSMSHPAWIVAVSMLFAVIQTGSINLGLFTTVPSEISGVLQAVLVFFVLAISSVSSRQRGN